MSDIGHDADRAVRTLIARYCDAVCRHDHQAWLDTWTEDGVWDIGRGEIRGHAALRATFVKAMSRFEHVLQLTHNGEAFDDDGTLRGRWYITEYGLTLKGLRTFYVCRYDDIYRYTPDGLRFAQRQGTWLYQGAPDLSGTFGPPSGYGASGVEQA